MFEKLKRKSFKFKIMATYILGLLIIGIIGYSYFLLTILHNNAIQVEKERQLLLQQNKDMARTAIEVAQNMIVATENLALSGVITKKQVKEIALEELNSIKYGLAGYVWCMKDDGTFLLDPAKSELVGKNIFKMKKVEPYLSLQEELENFRISNASFIHYKWYYPGLGSKIFDKISCVKYLPSIHWIIGSGFYIKDIDNQVNAFANQLKQKAIENFLISLIPGIFSSIISILLLYIILNKMFKPIEELAVLPDKFISENVSLDMKLPVVTDGPVGHLIENVNKYIEHLTKMMKFKETIGLVDSEAEIFEILAKLLEKELNARSYNIYSVSDGNTCKIISKGKIEPDLTERGMKATSKSLKWEEDYEEGLYFCFPIISSNKLIGIVEFCIPKDQFDKNKIITLEKMIQSTARDLDIKQLTEKLRLKTIRDNLTGLYNRWFLDEALETLTSSAIRHKESLAVVMTDIDDFKKINDTYGHKAGDMVLQMVADLFKRFFKRQSDMIIRYGGEEFLVIAQEIKEEDLLKLLEDFRKAVEKERIEVNGQTIGVTVSIGYAMVPDDTDDVRKAIELADYALYEAKKSGKNTIRRYKREDNNG